MMIIIIVLQDASDAIFQASRARPSSLPPVTNLRFPGFLKFPVPKFMHSCIPWIPSVSGS